MSEAWTCWLPSIFTGITLKDLSGVCIVQYACCIAQSYIQHDLRGLDRHLV
jgi:hypothetical protein